MLKLDNLLLNDQNVISNIQRDNTYYCIKSQDGYHIGKNYKLYYELTQSKIDFLVDKLKIYGGSFDYIFEKYTIPKMFTIEKYYDYDSLWIPGSGRIIIDEIAKIYKLSSKVNNFIALQSIA